MTLAVETFEPAGEGLLDGRLLTGFVVLVGVLVVAVLALLLWLLVRSLRHPGDDPASAARRPTPRPEASLAERLQELDDLHRRGVLSDAEHSMARHQALTSR